MIYDDWASADVARAETRRALANMAVVGSLGGFVNRVYGWGGRSERK